MDPAEREKSDEVVDPRRRRNAEDADEDADEERCRHGAGVARLHRDGDPFGSGTRASRIRRGVAAWEYVQVKKTSRWRYLEDMTLSTPSPSCRERSIGRCSARGTAARERRRRPRSERSVRQPTRGQAVLGSRNPVVKLIGSFLDPCAVVWVVSGPASSPARSCFAASSADAASPLVRHFPLAALNCIRWLALVLHPLDFDVLGGPVDNV